MAAEIGVGGVIVPKTVEGVGMYSKHVKDATQNKTQEDLNKQFIKDKTDTDAAIEKQGQAFDAKLTEQNKEIAKKSSKVRVDIVGSKGSYEFKKGSTVLSFKDLNNMLQGSPDFVVFIHGNREHRCTMIDLTSNPRQMRFVAPIVSEGSLKVQAFYVTSNDGTNITSITSIDINSENSSNKATDLSNPGNATYPTTKAVSDAIADAVALVEGQIPSLTPLETRMTTAEGNINTATTTLNTVKGKAEKVESDLSTLSGIVSSNKTEADKTATQVNALTPRMGKVESDLSNLGQNLGKIEDVISPRDIENRQIAADGTVSTSAGSANKCISVYDVSDYIGGKVRINSIGYSGGYRWSVFNANSKFSTSSYDTNADNVIRVSDNSEGGGFEEDITIQEGDKYLVVAIYKSDDNPHGAVAIVNKDRLGNIEKALSETENAINEEIRRSSGKDAEIENEIKSIAATTTLYATSHTKGVYKSSNGSFYPGYGGSTDTNYYTSDYIDVSTYNLVRIKSHKWGSASTDANSVTAFDADKNVLLNHCVKNNNGGEFLWEVPAGVSYIRITVYKSHIDEDEHYYYVTCISKIDVAKILLQQQIDELKPFADKSIIGLNGNEKSLNILSQMRYTHNGAYIKPLVLAHFSDIHADEIALQRILFYCDTYSQYIDGIVNTGDTVNNQFSSGFDWYANTEGTEKIMYVIGNHDTYNGTDMTAYGGTAECYNRYIAPFVSNWGVVQPSDAASAYKCYYYKDYTSQGVRLIVIDNMNINDTQLSWFEQTLNDAKSIGLAVVVALHCLGGQKTLIQSKFTTKRVLGDSWSSASSFLATNGFVQRVHNFIVGGGTFCCYIMGHWHSDAICYKEYNDGSTTTKQLIVDIDTANGINPAQPNDSVRVDGTKSRDCFNIIGFNTVLHRVNIFRVGCDYDNALQHKDTISIDYLNCEVL